MKLFRCLVAIAAGLAVATPLALSSPQTTDVRTKTSRSSGPANTAKGVFSTMALGIVRRSGDGPTSRRCGWTWYAGPWEIFPAMHLPDPRRQDNVLGALHIV